MGKPNGVVRIGAGSSFADDRIEPAVELVERGELDYIAFECLAERTIARENLTRQKDPEKGYTPRLLERMRAVLPASLQQGVRIITNMGAANPLGAARVVRRQAKEQGLGEVACAVVLGDDVSETLRRMPQLPLMETGAPLESLLPRMASANAYLGADVLLRALNTGAPVVISGRVADPSLFLAPALHHHGWSYDDLPRLAAGTLAGHILECGCQASGGCFADPGRKEVPDLAGLGLPFADIGAGGEVWIGKADGTGGRVDVATCTEQLLYELHDPANYITPDCVLDIEDVELRNVGPDRVQATGARGKPRTPTYKVTVGYHDGYIGEGQIGFAGINAVARAKLCEQIVMERLKRRGFSYSEVRVDLIGMSSLHGMGDGRPEPYEVRLRIAVRAADRRSAEAVGFEIRACHVNGPTGAGGGSDPSVKEVLAVQSVLIPREAVRPEIVVEGSA
ncbi:MAG TPA: acyclic terpene utilization AtuA family protein [Falsiroseomonas sp.]|nr:acyclic terpene utilization AtuA family protein [Falsiroseomonas sp.]